MSGVRLPDRIIFVSHSAKEGEAKSILDRLPDAIRDAGFHPFVSDFEIERGDPYKEVLDDRLAECHGAVLLLSPSALISDWVTTRRIFSSNVTSGRKGNSCCCPF